MNLTLDAETEKRIQREIDLGHYREPSKVIAHALDLLDAENDWFRDKQAIAEHLDEGFAQNERGERIPKDQVRDLLAKRRAHRDPAFGLWSDDGEASDGLVVQDKLRSEW